MTESAKVRHLNPFRPGAGHPPPFLAGRDDERARFQSLLQQQSILQNLILTGLRGVGKTVLMESWQPVAVDHGWLWVGADLSESSSTTEERLCVRILTDLAALTSAIPVSQEDRPIGFTTEAQESYLDFDCLLSWFHYTPGLNSDKIKAVLEGVWPLLKRLNKRGIVFAYDEAQNLSDHSSNDEFPLSLLLETFQSLQRKGFPFMLALTGLPTLFPKLVDARTYSERMFHVMILGRLSEQASRDAIEVPLKGSPLTFDDTEIDRIIALADGYPYFIQFLCRESYDFCAQIFDGAGEGLSSIQIPLDQMVLQLDTDFFQGRWGRATDRQRDLMKVIADLDTCDDEFTVQEVAEHSKRFGGKSFSASHVNQMLASLGNLGLVYKNRHGKYMFAVPLFASFIRRQ